MEAILCFVLAFGILIQGQTLPETSTSATQCVGLTLSAQCQSSQKMIVKDVNRGAKPTADGCAPTYVSYDNTCCSHASGDCMITHDSIDTFRGACNGKALCGDTGTVDSVASTGCDGTIMAVTNYLQMDYYCISDSRIMSMCPTSATTITETSGNAVYIQNRQYPNPIPQEDTSCSCSVETDKCDGTIEIYTVHIAPFEETGTCKQTVTVVDGSSSTEYTCATGTGYTVNMAASTGTYLTLTLTNSASADGGYVVVAFKATGSGATIYINCPAAAQTYCETTTTTTVSTTVSNPDDSGSDNKPGLSSGEIAGIVVGVVVGLIGLIIAVIIYFYKTRPNVCFRNREQSQTEEKRLEENQGREPSQPPNSSANGLPPIKNPPPADT